MVDDDDDDDDDDDEADKQNVDEDGEDDNDMVGNCLDDQPMGTTAESMVDEDDAWTVQNSLCRCAREGLAGSIPANVIKSP